MNVATLTRQNPTVTPSVTPAVPHPADAPPRSKRVRASPRWLLQRLALGLTLLFLVLPVAFLLATSFKSRDEVLSGYFFPLAPTWLNWRTLLSVAPLHLNLLNSLLVALLALFITLAIAVPAVYAVVKLRHGQRLAGWLLSSYLSPPVVALLPLFFVWRQAGLTNSTFGLALVDGLSNVPVAFWLLRGFFKQVPLALEDAVARQPAPDLARAHGHGHHLPDPQLQRIPVCLGAQQPPRSAHHHRGHFAVRGRARGEFRPDGRSLAAGHRAGVCVGAVVSETPHRRPGGRRHP